MTGRSLVFLSIAVALFCGCSGGRTHDSELGFRDGQHWNVTPWPVTPYPNWNHFRPIYSASDWDKPGHPALTHAEARSIRAALAMVKPCQRALLSYAFPENKDFLPMVLFFRGNGHVFGQHNVYYNESQGLASAYGAAGPPVPSDVRYDIEHTPCAHSNIQRTR